MKVNTAVLLIASNNLNIGMHLSKHELTCCELGVMIGLNSGLCDAGLSDFQLDWRSQGWEKAILMCLILIIIIIIILQCQTWHLGQGPGPSLSLCWLPPVQSAFRLLMSTPPSSVWYFLLRAVFGRYSIYFPWLLCSTNYQIKDCEDCGPEKV